MASKAVPSETQRSKLQRKEGVILEAARAIFVDHGFDGARMQEIARRAGIGEGTIYSYYESKAELMLAAVLGRADARGGGRYGISASR